MIKKESTNSKREKFMICKYSHKQFQLNAFVSKISNTEIHSRTVLGREVLFVYIKFLSFLEGKKMQTHYFEITDTAEGFMLLTKRCIL